MENPAINEIIPINLHYGRLIIPNTFVGAEWVRQYSVRLHVSWRKPGAAGRQGHAHVEDYPLAEARQVLPVSRVPAQSRKGEVGESQQKRFSLATQIVRLPYLDLGF
jgi:hypothetical protein